MAQIIQSGDLPADIASNAMAETWVAGANARASRVAPCLASTDPAPTDDQLAEAKLLLVGAIIRWSQAGAGALQSQGAGPYSTTIDTRQRTGYNLWPTEITQLQDICRGADQSVAFSVDTVQPAILHVPICSVNFGGECSCGASIAGVPIYAQGQP